MAKLSDLRMQLFAIKNRLPQILTFTAGRPASEADVDRCERDLKALIDQVKLIGREALSAGHLATAQAATAKKLPMEQRYAANQSAEQRRKEVALLLEACNSLKKEIEDLLVKNGLYNGSEMLAGVVEQIQHFEELIGHTEIPSRQPQLTSSSETMHIEPVITLVWLMLAYAAKKIKESRGSSTRKP